MARVDFYILSDDSHANLRAFACRLADKAWQQGNRILIQTNSIGESQQLDDLLWTFQDGSFLPHAIADDHGNDNNDNHDQPILISHQPLADSGFQLLINLSSRAAAEGQFERIAEILNQADDRKQVGRQHYKIYRDLGFELQHHEMKA